MGDEEFKLNSHEDIDDHVPIPMVSKKPLDSLDCISNTFDMTITDPLFDLDSEFTLNSDNPIFGIHNEESDESETETIMDEVQNNSPQNTAQIPPLYEKLNFDLTMPKPILTFSHFRYGIFDIFLLGYENEVFDPGIIVIYVESEDCKSSTDDIPALFALTKL
ncbi:hypothetical protein Tco_1409611 [Tanacetum coccineum]